jgi:hypothetical protein
MQKVISKAAGLKVTTGRRTWGTDDKYPSGGSVDFKDVTVGEKCWLANISWGGSVDYQGCNRWDELLTSKNQLGDLLTTKDATGGRSCWLARNSWGDLLTSKDTTGGRSCWLARISWENPRMQHVGGAVD